MMGTWEPIGYWPPRACYALAPHPRVPRVHADPRDPRAGRGCQWRPRSGRPPRAARGPQVPPGWMGSRVPPDFLELQVAQAPLAPLVPQVLQVRLDPKASRVRPDLVALRVPWVPRVPRVPLAPPGRTRPRSALGPA
jgi:hypothetical protein